MSAESTKPKEECGNAFFWDELKARTLCDMGIAPSNCLLLNSLGSAVLGASAYKMGVSGANTVEGMKAIKMFAEAEKLIAIEQKSGTISRQAGIEARSGKASPEATEKLMKFHDSMLTRSKAATEQLEKLIKSPYLNESMEYHKKVGSLNGTLPTNLKNVIVNPAQQALFEKIYIQYNEAAVDLKVAINIRKKALNRSADWDEPVTQKELLKMNENIAKVTKKLKALRGDTLAAYKNLYKGTLTSTAKRTGGAGAALGMMAAIPLLEMMKEPASRALCGFNSEETSKAMAEIGAVAIIEGKGKTCRIEIPNTKLMELGLQEEETLSSLPKPVCEAVKDQLKTMRERQEKERPFMVGTPQCSKEGFKISLEVNGRKYNHEYKKTTDGALTLNSSFFPQDGFDDSSILNMLPGGKDRFDFSINLSEGGTRWSKLKTPLAQWNTFADGDVLLSKPQGIDEAIKYYQALKDKQTPPSVKDARRSITSGSMTMNYVYSVGEQLMAVNKMLPEVLAYCESRLEEKTSVPVAPKNTIPR